MTKFAWITAAMVLAASAMGVSAEEKPAGGTATSVGSAVPRFFEMRTYIANEGKLDALHARFRDHTNALFKKHGIEIVGYWVPTDAEKSKTTLVYILAYPSKEAREASWKAFAADPEWKTAKAESEKNGSLVGKVISEYMTPTDYSPIK